MEPVSRFFNQQDWVATTSGAGSIVFSEGGKIVDCSALTGDQAFLQWFTVGWPGESFTFEVLGRNIETGKAGWAEAFIDSPLGFRREEGRIENKSMENIPLVYDVPVLSSGPRVIAFSIGVDTPTDGSAQFMIPRITRTSGDSIYLRALYRMEAGGGIAIHPTLPSFNTDLANISWNAADKAWDIVPTETVNFVSGTHKFKPHITVAGDPTNSDTNPVIWNVGALLDNGAFQLQALDAATGVALDLSAGVGVDLYVTVTSEF